MWRGQGCFESARGVRTPRRWAKSQVAESGALVTPKDRDLQRARYLFGNRERNGRFERLHDESSCAATAREAGQGKFQPRVRTSVAERL